MLKNVHTLLSPQLLKILCEMGHGDEIVIADGNFPAASMATNLVIVPGIEATDMLEAILTVFPLDQYDSNNFVLMEVCEGDTVEPVIWQEYKKVLEKYENGATMSYMERFEYYERAKKAYAIVATGESAQYANIILKKGCIIK